MKTELNRTEKAQDTFTGPLFVVGMWRSGTSLLYALLNQHPQIALMYEGDLPLMWPLFLGGKVKSDWLDRWEFWNSALSRHQLQRGKFPAEVAGLSAATEMAYQQYAGDAIWGCKSPSYHDAMEQLARDFPTARFIVIYRNPADICRSIVRAARKASWFSRSGMTLRALLGYAEMKKGADSLAGTGRVHPLQYEELVREPESVLRGICEFLQIPFDERMVSLENAERSAIYEAEHHAMVKGKQIRPTGPREEVLSPSLKRKIERYTHLWFEKYAGVWPMYREPESATAGNPGGLERLSDFLLYRSYRLFDQAVLLIYCFAPLSWPRAYREMKRPPEMAKQGERVPSPGAD
jgi:sulfotransferase family protein